jgi:hypothetical protein
MASHYCVGDRGLRGSTLACSDSRARDERARLKLEPGSTTLSENRKDVPRLLTVTDSNATHISRSELLMLLEGLHEKLNACFEDLRRLPQPTARFEASSRHSLSSE